MSYCEILIEGRNRSLLFKKLSKAKITIHNCKILGENKCVISVEQKYADKVFAICGKTWYNKQIKPSGISALINFLKTRFILVLGLALLICVACVSNCYVFSFEINGVNGAGKTQILSYLENNGIKKFSKFSSFDYSKISKDVLSICDDFSFVTAEKFGNRLVINVVQNKKEEIKSDVKSKNVVSTICGTVKFINAFSGTAVVSVGDRVEVGNVLIDGYFEFNGNRIETNAVGYVVVECEYVFEWASKTEFESENATRIAKFNCPKLNESNFVSSSVEIVPLGEGYNYKVKIFYLDKIGE